MRIRSRPLSDLQIQCKRRQWEKNEAQCKKTEEAAMCLRKIEVLVRERGKGKFPKED